MLRDRQADCSRGAKVDHKPELRWLLNRHLGRAFASQNLMNERRGAPKQEVRICLVGHETANLREGAQSCR